MITNIENSKIAVVGGGKRCKMLLEAVFTEKSPRNRPEIVGVAEIDHDAEGLRYAKEKSIFTTDDYKELLSIKDLDMVVELTEDIWLKESIKELKPPWVLLVDHYEARSLLDYFQIKAKKIETQQKIREVGGGAEVAGRLFEEFYEFVRKKNRDRDAYARDIREKLESEEWTMSQIVQGSTVPTFVIDKGHRVTQWNTACEKLTGYAAREMIGTDNQWKPFRDEKRPTLADLVVDGVKEEELWRYYGTRWEKSALLKDAYEAEEFFEQLGEEGKCLYYTAAPIKSPEGVVMGAIETLWDRTKEKLAEEEREHQNRELADKVSKLTASERAMSQIIQGSTIPTFVVDRQHRITHWNKALENMTGCSATDMVGTTKQWLPFYDKQRATMADVILDQVDELEIRKLYGNRWKKSVLIDGAYEAEIFFPDLGRKGKWCWFTAAPIKTPDGKLAGAIETLWDMTEDKKAEKERERHTRELAAFCSIYATLSSSKSLETRIEEAIEEVCAIFSIDGLCIFIRREDDRFCLNYNFGFSENICYQNRVAGESGLVAATAAERRIKVVEDLGQLDENEDYEVKLLKQEGVGALVYIPIMDKENKTFGVVRAASREPGHFGPDEARALELIGNRIGVAIENSMLHEEIQRRVNFQAKLIGSSNDGIVATDDKWNVVVFNPSAENMFGYSVKEVVGKMDARSLLTESIVQTFKEALVGEDADWTIPWRETVIMSRDSEEIPVRFFGTILHQKNRMMGTVAFFQDLREIKRLERELLSAERLAAVGQTVAGMAHCIKNILHGLKGGSYLVDVGIKKNKTDKLESGWDMVQRNIGRTSDLVQDLLSYSKERESEPEPCFPFHVASDVCELMEGKAEKHAVRIVNEVSPDIGEVVLDPKTLYRSLLNLVTNAIDACIFDESAEKHHQVVVKSEVEPENVIRFDVTDNGSGMTDEVKHKLFSSFFSTKGSQGTGLGLLVTRKLIEEANGSLTVESEWCKGSTFSVRLPYRIPENPTEP